MEVEPTLIVVSGYCASCLFFQVETMKKDLEVASEDSRRLTDKLFRLEEDNRQLEAMVSRLGGQDARRLKAQVIK